MEPITVKYKVLDARAKVPAEELGDTQRGAGGFGSTGR